MALEQAGFGVMLPAWWTRKGTKARIAIRANVKSPKMQAGGGLSMESVIRFNWEVALGGKKLTLNELRALSRLKTPLVRVRGQWVEMSASEIQTAMDFWKNKGSGQATLRELVRMALGAGDVAGGFDFSGVRATGWIGELLRQLEGRASFEELLQPDGFFEELESQRGRFAPLPTEYRVLEPVCHKVLYHPFEHVRRHSVCGHIGIEFFIGDSCIETVFAGSVTVCRCGLDQQLKLSRHRERPLERVRAGAT